MSGTNLFHRRFTKVKLILKRKTKVKLILKRKTKVKLVLQILVLLKRKRITNIKYNYEWINKYNMLFVIIRQLVPVH